MKNKKVDRIKFVKIAKAKIEALGMKVVEHHPIFDADADLKRYQYRNSKCLITLHEQHDHEVCYSVFCRFFESIPNFTGLTGKINFHEVGQLEGVLVALDKYLEQIKKHSIVKVYNTMYNVGRAKYVVNYHDGVQTHKDGSPFFGIAIFRNQIKLKQFISELKNDGYAVQ
jgi:hypothetical protein